MSEGVTWFVLKTPTSISDAEVARFAQLYPMNARPTQPLNGREVARPRESPMISWASVSRLAADEVIQVSTRVHNGEWRAQKFANRKYCHSRGKPLRDSRLCRADFHGRQVEHWR